jgi:hypothetical protein
MVVQEPSGFPAGGHVVGPPSVIPPSGPPGPERGAEQLAPLPPLTPAHVQVQGPLPVTIDGVPAVHSCPVGAVEAAAPLALPQAPFCGCVSTTPTVQAVADARSSAQGGQRTSARTGAILARPSGGGVASTRRRRVRACGERWPAGTRETVLQGRDHRRRQRIADASGTAMTMTSAEHRPRRER